MLARAKPGVKYADQHQSEKGAGRDRLKKARGVARDAGDEGTALIAEDDAQEDAEQCEEESGFDREPTNFYELLDMSHAAIAGWSEELHPR